MVGYSARGRGRGFWLIIFFGWEFVLGNKNLYFRGGCLQRPTFQRVGEEEAERRKETDVSGCWKTDIDCLIATLHSHLHTTAIVVGHFCRLRRRKEGRGKGQK